MSEKENDKDKDSKLGKKFWIFIGVMILVILGLWASSWFVIGCIINDANTKGTFGDSFGAVNALFSGLALAGVIVAIWLQSQELKEQRKELELTRNVLKSQEAQLKEQSDSLKKENFESTFFRMLDNLNKIVNGVILNHQRNTFRQGKFITHPTTLSGHQAFRKMTNDLREEMRSPQQSIDEAFQMTYKYNQDLSHFFLTLYYCLSFVYEQKITNKEKQKYANIIRAQLSSGQLLLIFYNAQTAKGTGSQFFIKQFNLLKNLNSEDLFFSEDIDILKDLQTRPQNSRI